MKRLTLDDTLAYCVLHGWQGWPEALSGDLDIVIDPQHLTKLEQSLHTQPASRPVQLLQHETSGFYFVLAFESAQAVDFLPVDAVTDYRRDGRVFFRADELLHDRRPREAWWVASPAVEFAYLLVKKVLKGAIAAPQKQRLHVLAQSLEHRAGTIARHCFGRRLGEAVFERLMADDWAALEAALPRLRRALLWHVLRRDPLNLWRYWGPEMLRIWRRWRYPTGLFVAVLGPDGAGKSALITHLRSAMAEAFRQSVVYHFQPDLLGRHTAPGPVSTPHALAPHPPGRSLLKLLYYSLDYGLGYLLHIRQHLVRSTLVLFDRYYDDLLVDSRRYRYAGPSWLAHWLQRLMPRPDVFFVLAAPGAQLRQRKQELPAAELERQQQAYQRLAATLPQAYVLDATAPQGEVARQARALMLDVLHARYLQRRSLWFAPPAPSLATYQHTLAPFVRLRASAEQTADTPGQGSAWLFGLLPFRDGRGYLVPLQSRHAAAAALRLYNPQTRTARLARQLLRLSFRLGLGQPFLRRIWLPRAGTPAPHGTPQAALLGYLQHLLAQEHLTFAMSLGTPGPQRKAVVQIMDAQGQTLGYAKVGHDATSNALVQNEVAMLRALAQTSWQSLSLPQVRSTAWFQDAFFCVLSPLPRAGQRLPAQLTALHLAALHELFTRHEVRMPLTRSPWWEALLQRVEQVPHAYYQRLLSRHLSRVAQWFDSVELPFGYTHGDFTPWNVWRHGHQLGLVDWECATALGPPLWDHLHFLFQTACLVKRWQVSRLAAAILEQRSQPGPLTRALRQFALADASLAPLALLYCSERLAFWAHTRPENTALLHTLSALSNRLGLEL